MSKNLKKNSYEGENIDIIVPQEIPDNYHKLPVALVRWQPYLNPIHYSILTYIVSRIHQRRCYAFPSIKTAADECNICENSFNKGANLLEALGLIAIERSAKGNKYFLRPPVEPSLNLIEKHLDNKAIKKFKKREIKEEGEISLNFKKVHYFKAKKTTSPKIQSQIPDKAANSSYEAEAPHEVSTNKIQSNLNLSNSNLNSDAAKNLKPKNKKIDVVNLDQVKTIRSYGITSKKAKELSKQLHSDIHLDSFIQYILNDVGKFVDIKNTSGFLIHGLTQLQEDYLDIERKKKGVTKEKNNKVKRVQQIKTIKEKIETKALSILNDWNDDEKKSIWRVIENNVDFLKSKDYSEEIREGFYLDYIYQNRLKLDSQALSLMSTDSLLMSQKDLDFLEQKVKELQIE